MLNIFEKIHHSLIERMDKSWVVENILIAKVLDDTKEPPEYIDCIYCTIIRNILVGFTIGILAGRFIL